MVAQAPPLRRSDPGLATPTFSAAFLHGLVGAAAVVAIVDLLLQRVLAPVYAHAEMPDRVQSIGEAAAASGRFAAAAGAALVVGAGAVLAGGLRRARQGLSTLLALALAATMLALIIQLPATAVLASMLVLAAVAGTVMSTRTGPAGVVAVLVGFAIFAGHWPILAERLAALIGAAAGLTDAAFRIGAEALFVLAALVGATLVSRRAGRSAWWAAGAAAAIVAALFLAADQYLAMLTLWVVGAPLGLPPIAYVVAAGGAALAAATWWSEPGGRLKVAGLCLILAAGLQPAVVHHSITALIGLMLIVLPAPEFGVGVEKSRVMR